MWKECHKSRCGGDHAPALILGVRREEMTITNMAMRRATEDRDRKRDGKYPTGDENIEDGTEEVMGGTR